MAWWAWKFNFKQHLLKTLYPRINIIEMRADSNIITKKSRKHKIFWTCERKKTAVHGTLWMVPMSRASTAHEFCIKLLNSRINILEVKRPLNIWRKSVILAKREKSAKSALIFVEVFCNFYRQFYSKFEFVIKWT